MKASELIRQLSVLIDKHGDLSVYQDRDWCDDETESVCYLPLKAHGDEIQSECFYLDIA